MIVKQKANGEEKKTFYVDSERNDLPFRLSYPDRANIVMVSHVHGNQKVKFDTSHNQLTSLVRVGG